MKNIIYIIIENGANGYILKFKINNLDFKGICLQDGPAGVRFNDGTSTTWQGNYEVNIYILN